MQAYLAEMQRIRAVSRLLGFREGVTLGISEGFMYEEFGCGDGYDLSYGNAWGEGNGRGSGYGDYFGDGDGLGCEYGNGPGNRYGGGQGFGTLHGGPDGNGGSLN